MAWRIDDRWLWLGLGALVAVGAKVVFYYIPRDILSQTEIRAPAPAPQDPVQNQADLIELLSLKALASNDNVDIGRAATRILLRRALKNPALLPSLIDDLGSEDEQIKNQAKQIFDLFIARSFSVDLEVGTVNDMRVQRSAQSANEVLDWLLNGPPSIGPRTRTVLPGEGPGGLDSEGDSDDSSAIRDDGAEGGEVMRSIAISDMNYSLPAGVHDQIMTGRRRRQVRVAVGQHGGPVGIEESPEEVELRRRSHREAMVFHEGPGGIGVDDIIEGPTASS
ncbi:MAG: hypothetical protein M1820_002763 [Bogoriella megaspora]|nr:MAG: hypothetical protein M1820_002763 [Bogoriella megaspora]